MRISDWSSDVCSSDRDGAPNFGPSSSSGSSKETPFTPRFGVSYEPGRDSLVYARAAKGFRPGGGNTSVPALCGLDSATLGLTEVPNTYESDSVWNTGGASYREKVLNTVRFSVV